MSHSVRLQQPYYATNRRAVLHRYMETDFVNRFQQDLTRNLFSNAEVFRWKQEDLFSRHDNTVVLRQPIHRTFYLLSCEVVCDRIGFPALGPERIDSAGFVIRRVGGGREEGWMLQDGEPMGWEPISGEDRDPDLYRRLCANGVLRKREMQPAYSGEETHPLHVATAYDEHGKRHTVLYGYLPLGGHYYLRLQKEKQAFSDAEAQSFMNQVGKELPWPFGVRGGTGQVWNGERDGRPVQTGYPTHEFYEFLRLLVNRYHLGEAGIEENTALENIARKLFFYDESHPRWKRRMISSIGFLDHNRHYFWPHKVFSLWDYLHACAQMGEDNPLVEWFATQENRITKFGGLNRISLNRLPAIPTPLKSIRVLRAFGQTRATQAPYLGNTGTQWQSGGDLQYTLYMGSADAQEIRQLLGERVFKQAEQTVREIPIPKFQQRAEDLYQLVPFVRCKDEQGKERIVWASDSLRTERFRVAAPFDAEASRPSLIQMPSLSDLRKGLSKGASMLIPPDTNKLLDSLKLGKGATADAVPEEPPSDGLGLQWICSFSLPVVTLVAMILLMIMISLLNIVFWWMPWVRICLPFPKMK
jgi:hypothetical protein